MKQPDYTSNLIDSTLYICVIPNAWGKGRTIAEAKRNSKIAACISHKPSYVVVYSYPADKDHTVYIDDMGYLYGEGLVKVSDDRNKHGEAQ